MTKPIDKPPDFILGVGNPNADEKATFELAVRGYLWEHDQSAEASDTFHSDAEMSGEVWGGWDFVAVRGYLTDFDLDGQAQVTINGQNVSTTDVTDYRPDRFTDGTGGSSDSSSNNSSSGSGGSNSSRGSPDSNYSVPDGAIDTDDDYRAAFALPIPNTEERRLDVAPGQYNPSAIQRTILHARPEYSLQVTGNPENPYAVDVSRANHNFTLLCKDEHFWVEGMLWGRTQFSGAADPYCRDMAFTDRHGKQQSAIGGKRASGRFINCDIGHKDAPDEYAAYYYGGGSVLFDRKNVFRASGSAYIGANNHVELHIDGSNEFASGDKEIVAGTGIRPSDLSDGMNVIQHGELR